MNEVLTLQQLQTWLNDTPFHQFMGMEITDFDLEKKTVSLRLPFRPEFERMPGSGQLHGGIMSSLIDVAGDFALVSLLKIPIPTINFRVDYLKMGVNTDLIAIATVRRAGRSVGVADVDVYNSDKELLAIGRGCYSTRST